MKPTKATVQTTICLLFVATVLVSCESNKLDVDVSSVKADVELTRLDQEWPQLTPVSFRKQQPTNTERLGELYQHYIEDVLQLGKLQDSNLFNEIRKFTTHKDMQQVFEDVAIIYPDDESLKNELDNVWSHYQYYFPNSPVPAHMTCMCGFNNPFILTDKGIGICLEMFLGEKSKFYQYLQTPRYMRQRMTPSHLALSMMKAWIESEFAPKSAQTTLLENIIFHGKVLYCLDAIFPTTADSIKIWYNKSEMDWANEHEKMVWAYFVDNDLLFETKLGIISKYTNDGPFTVDFAKESPGRMADYVGWQIIRKYMNKQEVVDLNELMNADASLILSESKYKP